MKYKVICKDIEEIIDVRNPKAAAIEFKKRHEELNDIIKVVNTMGDSFQFDSVKLV